MFSKVCGVILGIGIVAAGLLSMRQARMQAAHEMADVQRRVAEHDKTLWRLRIEIASRVRPDMVERAIKKKYGTLSPVSRERLAELVKREAEALAALPSPLPELEPER